MSRPQLAYLSIALFLGFLLVGAGNLAYTDHVDSERARAEQQANDARAQQAEATRQLVCELANGYLRIYRDNPPQNETQQQVRATWAAMASRFLCPPVN